MRKNWKAITLVFLCFIELKILFNLDTILFWPTKKIAIGSVLSKTQFLYMRNRGDLNWFPLQTDAKLRPGEEVIVKGFGHGHIKVGAATLVLPQENSFLALINSKRIEFSRGALWILTSGSESFEVEWKKKVLRVLPASQVYLNAAGEIHVLVGKAMWEEVALEKGQHQLSITDPVQSKSTSVMLLRPQPIEDFYFWTNSGVASHFSLPIRGAIATQGSIFDGTWVLELTDERGHKTNYQGEGNQLSQDFKVPPGRYLLRIILSNGEKSPLHVIHIQALKSPEIVFPQSKNLLLPLGKNSKVFFLWKGDPAVQFYEISIKSDVLPVSYPVVWFPILNQNKDSWVLNGKIRASHPIAGWSQPQKFNFQVKSVL